MNPNDLLDILITGILPLLGLGAIGPVVVRFLKSYKARKNPVSLAIAFTMVAVGAMATTPWWFQYLGKYAIEVLLILTNLGICLAFWWAVKKERSSFTDQRKRD